MLTRSLTVATALASLFVLQIGPTSLTQTNAQYQKRGDRWEGLKPAPVSGYDIELLSALIENREEASGAPSVYKVRFFLKDPTSVFLTVREKEPRYFYWLDKVAPAVPWRSGASNQFEWSTQPVLHGLDGLKLEDLGVVARLDRAEPARIEKVAPAQFFCTKAGPAARRYVFTFKPASMALLQFWVYKEGDGNPRFGPETVRKAPGGKPVAMPWDASQAEAGWYKLVVRGYFLQTDGTIDKTVVFYHQPNISGR